MRRFVTLAPILLAALGSCVSPTGPVPPRPAQPIPVPAPTPAPTPAPLPAPPLSAEWRDWPVTPGTWAYRQDARGSIALYGPVGADAELTLRCDRARGQIFLSRRGAGAGPTAMTIRTTSTLRPLTMLPTGGEPPYLAVALPVNDPLLDAIGFSRGKFVVEGAGLPPLVAPTWAELLRVTEDCRG